MSATHYDVIVIGGGATGAGTARDCALRGLKTLLVERFDLSNGATGRNHGLLHSGARYAVTDGESATECIRENMTLRRIAPGCVEETGGLFITLPEDDLNYQAKFVEACNKAGIKAEAIDPKEAIRLEPSVNPTLIGAVKVPDGSVDPFKLTNSNVYDAVNHGARVLTYHEVTSFIFDGDRIVGVNLLNLRDKTTSEAYADVTVNAGGIWGHHIAELAGATVSMFPAKGALLVFGHRVNNTVINRCRKPADADILVPGETITIIGTTSTRIPYEEVDDVRPTPDEVDLLLREGEKLAPALGTTRILRAYAGVRPLVAADNDPSGRNISRGIVCLDHEKRDGIKGFITITGGKLMTYRLMAEIATDMVCSKLGVNAKCRTAELVLPNQERTSGKLTGENLICECERVSEKKIDFVVNNLGTSSLSDIRKRTRMGMGTCQGELCAYRAATKILKATGNEEKVRKDLGAFMNERWKGIKPVAWGDTLREAQFTSWLYEGVNGLNEI